MEKTLCNHWRNGFPCDGSEPECGTASRIATPTEVREAIIHGRHERAKVLTSADMVAAISDCARLIERLSESVRRDQPANADVFFSLLTITERLMGEE